MTSKKDNSSPTDKKKTTPKTPNFPHTIGLSDETFEALSHLKHMFDMMAEGSEEVDYDDVVNVLVNGFAESMQSAEDSDDRCCGGHCGCK